MPTDRLPRQAETSTSFEEERAAPPPPRTFDSPFSFDPGDNLVGQGGFVEGSSQEYLPSFHRSGGQEGVSSAQTSVHSPSPRTWRNALKGWKVVFGSCRSSKVFIASEQLIDWAKGWTSFWYSYQYRWVGDANIFFDLTLLGLGSGQRRWPWNPHMAWHLLVRHPLLLQKLISLNWTAQSAFWR